jgi:hypothetical protein
VELLNEDRQRELLAQPESGMGYQAVEITLRNGENRYGTAFNAEYLLYSGEPLDRLDAISEPSRRSQMLEQNELGFGEEIVEIRVVTSDVASDSRVRERAGGDAYSSSSGASEAPPGALDKKEQFKRFSAFAKDRRITPARALSPGTCTTTAEDAKQVHSGRDAVRRYALPNPAPAVNVFTIDPPVPGTILQRGTAQPAYGQPGGGVEVIFVNGSPDKTVTGPKQIRP